MGSAMERADSRNGQRSLGARIYRFIAGFATRFGWGVADQTLSSLTNFALTVLVARSLGVTEFGYFAIVLTIYLTSMGLSRAAITSPLSIRFSYVFQAGVAGCRAIGDRQRSCLGDLDGNRLRGYRIACGRPASGSSCGAWDLSARSIAAGQLEICVLRKRTEVSGIR